MSWQGDTGHPSGRSQTNVPDYQKMLQAPQYSSTGLKESRQLHGAQTLMPSPVIHHPGTSQKGSGQYHAYHPSKYGLVAGSAHYPESQIADVRNVSHGERAVQYSSREGETIYRIQEAYVPSKAQYEDSYDQQSEMKSPPSRSGHDLQSGYRTPSKATTLPEFRELPAKGGSTSHGDMRQWQTQQREQYYAPQPAYDRTRQMRVMDGMMGQLSVKHDDESQWDPVRRAADGIIKEKDMTINKLKNKISMLEEDLSMYESKLRNAIVSKEDRDDTLYLKIQELQHKNRSLKTDFMDIKAQKNSELDELEIKLGAAEHELMQLKTILRNKEGETRDLQAKFSENQLEVDEWRSKFQEMKSSHHKMKANLDRLEQHLADLPTPEEKEDMAREVLKLREERAMKDATIEDLEDRLSQTRQMLSIREITLREMSERECQLSERLNDAGDEVERLRSEGTGAALYKAEVEVQELREEKERVSIDLEKAKQLLETTVRRLRHLERKSHSDMRNVNERLTQEEDMVTALRDEIAGKDNQIGEFRKAIKELGTANQDLMEQNLIMQEQLKHLELQCTDETLKKQRQLMCELGMCFSELQSLVQVCMQRARGEEPNMSMLLGIKSVQVEESSDNSSGSQNQTMMQWLSKVSELRSDVDKLRSIISNKYAEEMGDNLECNQQ